MARHEQHNYAPHWEARIAEGIKRQRIAQGMTQAEMAERMSDLGFRFHQATVYKIEGGDRRVTAAEAWGIAEVLDVTLDSLFWPEESEESPQDMRRLIRTQADRVLQQMLDLDEAAIRVRLSHRRLVDTVRRASARGITEHRTINDPEVPIATYYQGLLMVSLHNELLWRLRNEVWGERNPEFLELAAWISGIVGLTDFEDIDVYYGDASAEGGERPTLPFGLGALDLRQLERENWHVNHEMPESVFNKFAELVFESASADG